MKARNRERHELKPDGSGLCLNHSGPFRAAAAFTLVEVMLAIAIFALLVSAIFGSWTAVLRSSKFGLSAAAQAQRTRVSMRALEESLGGAVLYGGSVPYYSFFADTTSGSFPILSFVSHLPPTFPGAGLYEGEPVRRVTFEVDVGQRGRNFLVLKQSPFLEPTDRDFQPYTLVLATNVAVFQAEFWKSTKKEWVNEWQATNQLPKMVRIALAFSPRGTAVRPEEVAVQTVYLAAAPIPRQYQVPLARPIAVTPPAGAQGTPPGGGSGIPAITR